jgi:uncharacterized protein (TIGR02611 family)
MHRNRGLSLITKVVVTLVGSVVLAAGAIMMVTPGPGLLGIAAGLAILATEWAWAERWLGAARSRHDRARIAALGPARTTPARRRWLAGGAGAAALVTTVAALILGPDLLGG